MEQRRDIHSAERDRENPDRDRKKNIKREEEDTDISRQRGRQGERGKRHDKEDMEDENE